VSLHTNLISREQQSKQTLNTKKIFMQRDKQKEEKEKKFVRVINQDFFHSIVNYR
jgi:hypothetical protein